MQAAGSPGVQAGGDSLDPARVATLTNQKQQLLERLIASRARTAATATHVETLRAGDADPIVLIHPVGGDLFCYGALARRLPTGTAVIGIGPDELLRGDDAPSIQTLAARYQQRLADAGVRPAVLAGWSFGGVVAYEIARQGAAHGRQIPVVLIDSMPRPPGYDGMTPSHRQLLEMFVRDLLLSRGFDPDACPVPDGVWDLPADAALPQISQRLADQGTPLGLPAEELNTRHQVFGNAVRALVSYDPKPYDGRVYLLRATEWEGPNQARAWRQCVTGELVVAEVPTHHYALLREPALAQTVAAVEEARTAGRPAREQPGAEPGAPAVIEPSTAPVTEPSAPAVIEPSAPFEAGLEYWRERLTGVEPVSWPADLSDPDHQTRSVKFRVGSSAARAVTRLAEQYWTGPAVIYASVLQLLLARVGPHADQETDVVIGLEHGDTLLAARQHIDPEESFASLLLRATADAARDRYHPADLEMLRRAGRRLPFCVLLAVESGQPADICPGGGAGQRAVRGEVDLAVVIGADGLHGRIDYDAGIIRAATADAIASAFRRLLRQAARTPWIAAGDLAMGPKATIPPPPPAADDRTALDLVRDAVRWYPDAVAVRWPGGQLSYRDLAAAASQLAADLHGARLVAVSGRRSPQVTVAVLAALIAGAGYLPLDPSYPTNRRDYMLADARPDVLLCPAADVESLTVPADCQVVGMDRICAGADQMPLPPEGLPPAYGGDAGGKTAYVMYTSGSTGRPKGVVMPHSVLANLLRVQRSRSAAGTGWNTLQFTPISFDVSFQEIFSTWATGGTLVLVDEDVRVDPQRLLEYLRVQQVHRIFLPYVALRLLAETAVRLGSFPPDLREVVTAGEQLKISPAIREFFVRTGARLDNQYGPTETHVVMTEMLSSDPATWPELPTIGTPIAGATVHILDARQRPVPAGVPGEIGVCGAVLADGYLGRPDLTAERFGPPCGPRLYRTGDIGRLLADGRVEYLGRRDGQLKLRGFRVEVGEIESQLRGHAGVADAIVLTADADDPVAAHLVAYCTPRDGVRLDARGLQQHLGAELPAHMIPSRFVFLDRFPLTPSGKVDRRALVKPEPATVTAAADAEPAERTDTAEPTPAMPGPELTESQAIIAQMYADLLGVKRPGAEASFFELGGNSLSLARLATRLEETFGPVVSLSELFTHNTVGGQAELMDRLFAAELEEYSGDETAAVLSQMVPTQE